MKALHNYRYSFLAGGFAACGSFFGKLPSMIAAWQLLERRSQESEGIQRLLEFLIYGLPFVAMVVCNVLNWRYFLKALQLTEQTLTATVLTAATNYMVSFLLAALVYGEEVSWLSSSGALLIVIGLWFLCDVETNHKDKSKTN